MSNLGSLNRNGRHMACKTGLLVGVLLTWAVLAAAAMACGGERDQRDSSEIVTGMIVEVEARSMVDLDSLTVRDAGGTTWRFVAREVRGFTPSHLNEHRVLGQAVTVSFHRENGELIVETITD